MWIFPSAGTPATESRRLQAPRNGSGAAVSGGAQCDRGGRDDVTVWGTASARYRHRMGGGGARRPGGGSHRRGVGEVGRHALRRGHRRDRPGGSKILRDYRRQAHTLAVTAAGIAYLTTSAGPADRHHWASRIALNQVTKQPLAIRVGRPTIKILRCVRMQRYCMNVSW